MKVHDNNFPQLLFTNVTGIPSLTSASANAAMGVVADNLYMFNSTGGSTAISNLGAADGLNRIAAGSQTAGTMATVLFQNGSGVTFGMGNSSVITASVETNYQSAGAYLTTAALSQDSSKYAGVAGAITGGSITVNTAGVSVNLPAYLTTAALSANTSNYAGLNGAITGGSLTVNTSGVSINLPAYLTTAALSANTSNYAGVNGAITGGSLTVNTSGVSINLPAYLTTAALSANTSNYAGLNSAITGGSMTVNTSGISLNIPAGAADGYNIVSLGTSTFGGGTGGTVFSTSASTIGFHAGSNITISASSNSLIFYAGAGGTGGGAAISAAGNSQNTGTVSFADASGVSFGLATDGKMTASVRTNYQSAGAYLTTAALSANTSNYAGVNGAITGGSITVNTSGVSINLPAYLTTAALSANTSNYAGLNGAITGGSLTVNTSGVSINLPAYLTTAMQSGSSSVFARTGFTTTATAGTEVVATHDTNGLKLGVPAYITTAMLSNAATISNIRVSAGATSNNLSAITFANSNNFSFGLNGSVITASYTVPTIPAPDEGYVSVGTDLWNIVGGTLSFDNKNGVSWGFDTNAPGYITASVRTSYAGLNSAITGGSMTVNTSGISIDMPAQAPSPIVFSAGAASASISNIVFSNSNNISFGLNGSTITASYSVTAAYLTTAALSANTSNYAGINSAITGGSMTVNTSGISINVAGGAPSISRWANILQGVGRSESPPQWQTCATSQSSIFIMPLCIDGGMWHGNMTISTMFVALSGSVSGAASTAAKTYSMFIGLYTENASTLSLLNSVSASVGSGGAAANMTASFNGPRLFSAVSSAWSVQPVLTDGGNYYLAYMMQSAGESFALSWRGVAGASGQNSGTMGSSIAATATTMKTSPWRGMYTAQSAVMPTAISQAHVRGTASNEMFVPVILFENLMSSF